MDALDTTTRFWVPPKTHPDCKIRIRDGTGQNMLETLERIFTELDEMGVQADTVTCPHADEVRGIGTLVYMGHTLDFCRECHGHVAAELGRQVDELRGKLNIPDDYRWPRPDGSELLLGRLMKKSPAPA